MPWKINDVALKLDWSFSNQPSDFVTYRGHDNQWSVRHQTHPFTPTPPMGAKAEAGSSDWLGDGSHDQPHALIGPTDIMSREAR